jgi:hypothetical protein
MAGVDWSMLEKLREQGAVKVSFHASGELASVEFGHPTASKDDSSTKAPEAPPKRRMSATGGLVPRVVADPQ